MADKVVTILRQITGDTIAVVGTPVYIGGNPFNVQTEVPASSTVAAIDVSNDKYNWVSARDFLGDTLTSLGDVISFVDSRPMWARLATAGDTIAGRTWNAIFSIRKEE